MGKAIRSEEKTQEEKKKKEEKEGQTKRRARRAFVGSTRPDPLLNLVRPSAPSQVLLRHVGGETGGVPPKEKKREKRRQEGSSYPNRQTRWRKSRS